MLPDPIWQSEQAKIVSHAFTYLHEQSRQTDNFRDWLDLADAKKILVKAEARIVRGE